MHSRQVAHARKGEAFNLFSFRSNGHLGAHVDAPRFLDQDQSSVEQMKLESFLGDCQLIRIQAAKNSPISLSSLENLTIQSSRLLIDTGTFNGDREFDTNFAYLTAEVVEHLFERGVKTIGIDTPSIDAFTTKEWPCHRTCFAKGIALIEGLLLWKVPVNRYELIALPLKLEGFDASPVRAILRLLK